MAGIARFGTYELRALLGKGGMAQVYRAVRVGPHGFTKEVALKILDPAATASKEQVDQLTDEARLGGLLRHPNIVATDELGQVGSLHYIAMELVDGWPLESFLRIHREESTPIPTAVVLEILIEVCSGLAYAHSLTDRHGTSLKLVHRDMKPGNVMISRLGQVKIMDFGIAKATTNLYSTHEQLTRGTPLFMSPEQIAGSELDGRSDLFSVGSMMQELITREATFTGEELIPILRAVLEVDINEATERLEQTFPEIVPVFLRCMQADPADRYPDASALQSELQSLRARLGGTPALKAWVAEMSRQLPHIEDGDLGDSLPGVSVILNTNPGENNTISNPTRAVDEMPSWFKMPLGLPADLARGQPTTSGDSFFDLNDEKASATGDAPQRPGWMAAGSFMPPAPVPPTPTAPPAEGFVKPGRPLAPLNDSVRRAKPPKKGPPQGAPLDMAAVPKLPENHPLFRHDGRAHRDLPAIRRPTEPPKARPGARIQAAHSFQTPQRPTRSSAVGAVGPSAPFSPPRHKAPEQPGQTAHAHARRLRPTAHKAGDRLKNRPRGAALVRAVVVLGVLGALVDGYSRVPGTLGDIARAIIELLQRVTGG